MTIVITRKFAEFAPINSVAFGAITGSYVALGAPFPSQNRILKIVNTCDTNMLFSFDGTTDQDVVAAGGFFLYDFVLNELVLERFTQVFIKFVNAPSSGVVYVVAISGVGE